MHELLESLPESTAADFISALANNVIPVYKGTVSVYAVNDTQESYLLGQGLQSGTSDADGPGSLEDLLAGSIMSDEAKAEAKKHQIVSVSLSSDDTASLASAREEVHHISAVFTGRRIESGTVSEGQRQRALRKIIGTPAEDVEYYSVTDRYSFPNIELS